MIAIGGQDCHVNEKGAHTGDVSAGMLKDAGASFVIVGHSERRADHGETGAIVEAKAEAVLASSLTRSSVSVKPYLNGKAARRSALSSSKCSPRFLMRRVIDVK